MLPPQVGPLQAVEKVQGKLTSYLRIKGRVLCKTLEK